MSALRERQGERPRTDLDSLRQCGESARAPNPRPQGVEERGRGKSARVCSDAETTKADRSGESGVVEGAEAATLGLFFCVLDLSYIYNERRPECLLAT